MSLQFCKKLCVRKEPERGCLAKLNSPAPKDSCPILHLPPEVRACIFNFLIDEVALTYHFSQDFNDAQCFARWPEYKKKLSFLKACKLFEAEALSLIQVKSVTFETHQSFDRLGDTSSIAKSKGLVHPIHATIWRSCPQEVPIPLSRVRPYLREIRLDPSMLSSLHAETDLLSSFPKLQTIRVIQKSTHEQCGSEYRDRLEQPFQRRKLMVSSLLKRHSCRSNVTKQLSNHSSSTNDTSSGDTSNSSQESLAQQTPKPRSRYVTRNLTTILEKTLSSISVPILVDVTIDFTSDYQHDDQHWQHHPTQSQREQSQQRIEPIYPVTRNVSTVRLTYRWPKMKIVDMEVDLWSQPMEMAIKSKCTEKISLVVPKSSHAPTNSATEVIVSVG